LWKLLVTITLCKTRSHARKHTAQRRDPKTERPLVDDLRFQDRQTSHEDALAFWEEIDAVLDGLPERTGQILSMRLEGKNKTEIASELNLSRQTIHRILKLLEERLKERFERYPADDLMESE
jgi:RNA polymerase sigma factor (sigma-70 family)